MKKYLSFVLAVLFLLALCPAALAEGGAVFRVVTPEELPAADEVFCVEVELEENAAFAALQFLLRFDTEKLTCVNAEAGELTEGAYCVTNPNASQGAMVVVASVSAITGSGTVARFTFRAMTEITAWGLELLDIRLTDEEGTEIPYRVGFASDPELGEPTEPGEPAEPEEPTEPGEPAEPGEPTEPGEPAEPGEPTEPGEPAEPGEPTEPGEPAEPGEPTEPGEPAEPEEPGGSEEPAGQEGTAEPEQCRFPDAEGHWGERYISLAAERGLFVGYEDGSFKPDEAISRAQFVTVLWRMAGKPEASADAPFTDLDGQSEEFRSAIAWAAENGHINGRGNGIFDPNGSLKREEAMTILFRYSGGMSGMELMFTGIYDAKYLDSGEISPWARPAMYWAVYQEVISGVSETALAPQKTATRAELSKILVNYMDGV